MPWNGSGSYILPPAYSPEVNGTVIDAVRYNGLTSDVASGISNTIARDGQNVPSANLPMSGFKHTGAGDGAAAGQYLTYAQATNAYVGGKFGVGVTPTEQLTVAGGVKIQGPSILGGTASQTFSFETPILRYYIGDGTGYDFRLSSRVASATTDRVVFPDSGNVRIDAIGQIRSKNAIGDTGGLRIWSDVSGNGNIFEYFNAALIFGVNDIEVARLTSTGLGLGVTPSYKLHVEALTAVQGVVVQGTNASGIRQDFVTSGTPRGYIGAGATVFTGGGLSDFGIASQGALLFGGVGGVVRGGFDTSGRFYGTGFHNNASSPTGTTSQFIASGTYTPTLTTVSGSSGASVVSSFKWLRVGNVVTVSGVIAFTATGVGTQVQIGISLPLASNLAATGDLAGIGTQEIVGTSNAMAIRADTGNDRANLSYNPAVATAYTIVPVSFQYEVL